MPNDHRIGSFSLPVKDQEAALRWFTEVLGWVKRTDVPGKRRYVSVSPPGQPEVELVLAPWTPEGTPNVVILTADVRRATAELQGKGIAFTGPVEVHPYATWSQFRDATGNLYTLFQKPPSP